MQLAPLGVVARRLRLQFGGAIYHVINRGNYRRDVFDSAGAAKAFECALDDACQRYHWRLHGYVIMRNHYHLAIETPEPNLVEGMHWLQSTYATRLNRLRSERGHLFQGRYQALLIEDAATLARVVNYIHLNPVRAKIVVATQVAAFRWSSLARFPKPARPGWLGADWLAQLNLDDTRAGWDEYVSILIELGKAADDGGQHREFCRGSAIGTLGWRRAIAKDQANLALFAGAPAAELRDFKHAKWQEALEQILRESGRSPESAFTDSKGAEWKCIAAERLRKEAGAPHRWIAEVLCMGSPNSVRSYLSRRQRHEKQDNQQVSA